MAFHQTTPLPIVAACCLIIATGSLSLAAGKKLPIQPRAEIRIEKATLASMTLIDPYRWMEDRDSPEFAAWVKGQDEYTRALLDAYTERAQISKRILELSGERDESRQIRRRRDMIFYCGRPAKANTYKLFVRGGREGATRILFDPSASTEESGLSIDYYEPSPDGRYAALGIAANGSEDPLLRVIEVSTGRLLTERIARTRSAMPQWRPDGESFFYMRRPSLAPDAPAAARGQRARSYLHVVGTDASRDAAVFGYDVSPQILVGISDSTWVRSYPGSPYALAIARRGAKTDRTIYFAPLKSVVDSRTPWKKLTDVEDGVDDYAVHGHDIYLLTHKDAPRSKVIRTSLDAPDLAHAEVVVPPGNAVAQELAVASDALYVRMLDGGVGRIVRVPFDGSPASPLTLPFAGAVKQFDAAPSLPGISFQLESWTRPRMTYAYDPATGRFSQLVVTELSGNQTVPLESKDVTVASADGALIPLSIVYRRGLDLSVPHPTMLTAYGSYGEPLDPYFDPRQQAWFERDGIYAVAHVRGGGEYGEEWHVAGMKQNKQNTIDDYLACARYLIKQKLSSAALLAAEGASAGGITIGSAITQHPELFGAAVIYVGIIDPLRFESTALGAVNAREFGSAANPAELPALYAMSAYYHVIDGMSYPAVLLTGGAHDARVPLWQPAKMAARLQAATRSGKPVLLRIDHEGGHGYSNELDYDSELGDAYAFLLWHLGRARATRR